MIGVRRLGHLRTEDRDGRYPYEVHVNGERIATFDHARRDGLASCLRAAAEAAERAERESIRARKNNLMELYAEEAKPEKAARRRQAG
jgi:hypothetical protein